MIFFMSRKKIKTKTLTNQVLVFEIELEESKYKQRVKILNDTTSWLSMR